MPPKIKSPLQIQSQMQESSSTVPEPSQSHDLAWTPQFPILHFPTFASYPDRNSSSSISNKQFQRSPFEFSAKIRRPPKTGRIEKRKTTSPLMNGLIRKRISMDKIDPDFVDSNFFEMLRFNRRQSSGSTSSTSSDSSLASLVSRSKLTLLFTSRESFIVSILLCYEMTNRKYFFLPS